MLNKSRNSLTLTIVIPVYNEQRYIKACLDSIAAQAVMPDEVIVVDNNSTDHTAAIARSYPFVRIIKEPSQGVVFARNAGFNAVNSDLIGRIDGDSVLDKDWVVAVKNQYVDDGSQAFYAATAPSRFRNFGGRYTWYPLHRIFYFWTSKLLLNHHTLSGSNMFMTRNLWQKVRDDVCLRTDIHEDMDLSLHIHKFGAKVNFVKTIKNSMAGRKIAYKLRNYPHMWLKIKLIEH